MALSRKRLRLADAAALGSGEGKDGKRRDVQEVDRLDAAGQGYQDVEDLSPFVSLRRLDLSRNELSKLDCVAFNKEITWINVAENRLQSLEGLEKLSKLTVLNASHNQLARISHLPDPTALLALVLSNNRIVKVEGLNKATTLTTLILSHNRLTELTGIATLRNLVKLSVAHNDLHNLPSLAHCPQLKELRLNDNKLIALPSDLRQNNAIEVLDVGNNLVRELSDVSVVGQLPNLINLNFKGNVVATKDNYAPNVKDMVKSLRILDGERFDQKYVQRKLKRDALSRKRSPESAPTSDNDGEAEKDRTARQPKEQPPKELPKEEDPVEPPAKKQKNKHADPFFMPKEEPKRAVVVVEKKQPKPVVVVEKKPTKAAKEAPKHVSKQAIADQRPTKPEQRATKREQPDQRAGVVKVIKAATATSTAAAPVAASAKTIWAELPKATTGDSVGLGVGSGWD